MGLSLSSIFLFSPSANAVNGLNAYVWDVLGQNAAPILPDGLQPVVTTIVNNIDYQWSSGSVLGGPSEDVIVQFTGYITSPVTQDISFLATADDGTRLYLDGTLITDDWRDKGGGGTTSSPVHFEANVSKQITLWYYENGGGAAVHLYWDINGYMTIVPTTAFSTSISTSPPPPTPQLNVPTNVQGILTQDKISVTWSAPQNSVSQIERYAIFWSYDNFQSGWGIASLTTSATINNLPDSTTVYIKIRADNDTIPVYSDWSETIQIVTGTYKADKAAADLLAQQALQAEQQRQVNANTAVTNYESATITSLSDYISIQSLKTIAESSVSSVQNLVIKTALQDRINNKSVQVENTKSQLEAERAAAIAAAEAEAARIAAIKAEQERIAAEKAAKEAEEARLKAEAEAKAAEEARIAAEKAAKEAEIAKQKAEEEARIQAEKDAKAKVDAEKAAQEAKVAEEAKAKAEAEAEAARIAAIKAEQERIAAEKAAKEAEEARLKAEAEAKAAEEARIAAEKAAKEAEIAKQKAEEEARIQAEKDAKAKVDAEKAAQEAKVAEEAKAKAEAEAKAKEEAAKKAEADKIKAEEEAKKAEQKAAEDAKKKAMEEAAKAAESGKELTEEQKTEVVNILIENAISSGQTITADQIQSSGIEYKDLPPATPVEVRTDANGNEVVITAEVAAQVELVSDPAALAAELFNDPGAAIAALGSIGADMSPEERKESTEAVVATVIAAGAAINAVGVASAGSTGGSPTGGGSGGGNSGGPSGSSGARRRET